MKNSVLFVFFFAVIAFGSERWYPMRVEYSNNGCNAIGVSSGIWWSLHEDVIPIDAYGPTMGFKALVNGNELWPGMQVGFEANALFLCARMLCNAYWMNSSSYITQVNPQVGLTWLSIVNVYVGYSKKISGTSAANFNEVNMAFCVNLPSYFFHDI